MTFHSRGRIFFFVTLGRMPLYLPSPYSPTELLFSLLECGERQMRSESASALPSRTNFFLKHLKRSFSQFAHSVRRSRSHDFHWPHCFLHILKAVGVHDSVIELSLGILPGKLHSQKAAAQKVGIVVRPDGAARSAISFDHGLKESHRAARIIAEINNILQSEPVGLVFNSA